jgi:hypothetical protein
MSFVVIMSFWSLFAAMANDPRYTTIRELIADGYIKTLRGIFDKQIISRSKVARDLGLNPARFSRNLKEPSRFILKDLYSLADLIGIQGIDVLRLVDADIPKPKRTKKTK